MWFDVNLYKYMCKFEAHEDLGGLKNTAEFKSHVRNNLLEGLTSHIQSYGDFRYLWMQKVGSVAFFEAELNSSAMTLRLLVSKSVPPQLSRRWVLHLALINTEPPRFPILVLW
jgi:hypothetical protein